MEMDCKPSEGDSENGTEATMQAATQSDEVRVSTVITPYLLAQSEELQQLSRLCQQVSTYFWSQPLVCH